jgi:hypothetical protein
MKGLLLLIAFVATTVHGLAWTIDAGDERCVEQVFEAHKTVRKFRVNVCLELAMFSSSVVVV